MATINTTKTNKNAVEICNELSKNGTTIEYIVINGQKVGVLGSAGDKDRAAAIKTIQTALDASDGDIYEMMRKLSTIATIEENGITADEMVKICGTDVIISYEDRAAYLLNGKEIANCNDLCDMPDEAIKAVLIARAETVLS